MSCQCPVLPTTSFRLLLQFCFGSSSSYVRASSLLVWAEAVDNAIQILSAYYGTDLLQACWFAHPPAQVLICKGRDGSCKTCGYWPEVGSASPCNTRHCVSVLRRILATSHLLILAQAGRAKANQPEGADREDLTVADRAPEMSYSGKACNQIA